MIDIKGIYNTARCFTDQLEPIADGQIQAVCDEEAFAGSRIRVMPDVHADMGCTIGTTMTISDKVVPGMVGVDIGCGMETVRLEKCHIDFYALDDLIRRRIPSGQEVRKEDHPYNAEIDLNELRCAPYVNLFRARRSIGTLGGGNHFIELDANEKGELFLVIHSGSRYLGKQVCEYYQNEGYRALTGCARFQIDQTIKELKAQGRHKEINDTVKKLKQEREKTASVPRNLAWVEGQLFEDYIHDMRIVQRFAALNRKAMTDVILSGLGLTAAEQFTTIHNYIDTDEMILRKGAVSAKKGEKLLIPINMPDGSLICIGRGNPDWNCSAPHGAGRMMSRKQAFAQLSLDEYRAEMAGVYTTSVMQETLDESPMAYKTMDEIVSQIGPTADIVEHIRPVYNFKAAE